MNKVTFGIAALSVAFAGAALAQTPSNSAASGMKTGSDSMHGQFGTLDTNHDGRISRDEAKAQGDLTSSWSTLDADTDTYLSESEFGKWKAPGNSGGSQSGAASGSRPGSGSSMPNSGARTGTDASKSQGSMDSNRGSGSSQSTTGSGSSQSSTGSGSSQSTTGSQRSDTGASQPAR